MKRKGFVKGINLGGWFSQCDLSIERLDNFITEKDFAKISEWGLDHVRIPIDYELITDSSKNGWDRIENAVALCRKYNLKVVLDLHKTAGFSFDEGSDETGFFENEKYQEQFYEIWEKFAEKFGNDPDNTAFELLNEITDEEYLKPWLRISEECIKRIRKKAPETLILIGSYNNNGAEQVQYLEKPYDENVIYNFHCYEPLEFTHQGATWTVKINPEKRVSFDESGITEEFFENLFSTAIKKAEENNTTLYCGEYGMIDIADAEDSLKWFKTINSVFVKHGISRSAWNYKELDFGITDRKYDGLREELIKYL